MPTTWASTSVFSPDRPAKRPVGARRILPSSRAGPNPLGENQSLSSPPLEPRGLLLSVMRQKVGKERSQEGCAPLANPRHFLACPLRKFGPSPTPLRLCKTPVGVPSGTAEDGDSASRYFLRPRLSRELTITGRTPGGNATSPDERRDQPWGGGWPEHSVGVRFLYLPTDFKLLTAKFRPAPLKSCTPGLPQLRCSQIRRGFGKIV